jgi:protein SCO1/2
LATGVGLGAGVRFTTVFTPVPRRRASAVLAVGALTLAGLAGCSSSATLDSGQATTTTEPDLTGFVPSAFSALVRTPLPQVDAIPTFAYDSNGQPESYPLRAQPGGLLLVYFGYTSCPDICPTTMADVRDARSKINPLFDEAIDVVMFSVDPETDTPETLTSYVTSFNDDARAMVTQSDEELRAIGKPFLTSWTLVPEADGVNKVEHTTMLYGVNDQGQLVATWPFSPDSVQSLQMAFDFEALLAGDVPQIRDAANTTTAP